MKGRFLMSSNEVPQEGNVYADKSALILDWLFREGASKEGFTLREVVREMGVSLGLVQRVFQVLIQKGLLQVEGVRTSKKFYFKKPVLLLKSWQKHYSIVKKCRMWTYRSGFQGKAELIAALSKSGLRSKVVLALHSAAEGYGCKNTNLDTLELYMQDSSDRPKLEKVLQLEPQEKGYEVLLIEPYYKSLLDLGVDLDNSIKMCPVLLTFLDLYHFPVRGQEQAEFMVQRIPELKRIMKKR